MFTMKLAEHYFVIDNQYSYIERMCRDYVCNLDQVHNEEKSYNIISVSKEEILREQGEKAHYSMDYLESLAIYRKICEQLVFDDVLLMHGSVLSIDGRGVMFTAPSGTGKSTQARLWREYFMERVVMINDDKPLIHVQPEKNIVYGTPWCGKHGLQTNSYCNLDTIFIVEQAKENHVEKLNYKNVYPVLMNQVYRLATVAGMKKMLSNFEQLMANVSIYRLQCNISYEAVEKAYQALEKEVKI